LFVSSHQTRPRSLPCFPLPPDMVRASGEKVPCQHCGESFSKRGLSAHQVACARRHLQSDIAELEAQLETLAENIVEPVPDDINVAINGPEALQDHGPIISNTPGDNDETALPLAEPSIQINDIKTIYHQNSGREDEISHFSDYNTKPSQQQSDWTDSKPWFPFQRRIDFEIAEFALKAALNHEQTDTLLSLFHRVQSGETTTLNNHAHIKKTWRKASEVLALTSFQKTVLSVPYRNEELSFDFWYRPLWDWALDLLRDPLLAPHFVWDAQRLYKYNGHSWDRFYHEPWTAKAWWRAQVLTFTFNLM